MYIDSHCHLDYFTDDLTAVLTRAKVAGIGCMQTICTSMANFPVVYSIAAEHQDVFASVGLHPLHCKEENPPTAEALQKIIEQSPKVVGIGETGLDFHYERDFTLHAVQKQSFVQHIIASQASDLPVIIHSREAEADTMRILGDMYAQKPFGAVLHCFTSTSELAEFVVALGMFVSASGIVTFAKSQALCDIFAKYVPLENLLIETDAPYLAPVPYRGKKNEPAYVVEVCRKMADVYGVDEKRIAAITSENFRRLFLKKQSK